MGLLDDAIRQHLELKRRHGADPSDVAKLEHEAFGPIEREDALEVADARTPVGEATHETAREEELAYEEAELEAEEAWAVEHPAAPAAPAEPEPEPVRERRVAEPLAAEPELAPPAPAPPHAREPEPVDELDEPAPEPLRPGGSVRLDDVGERTVEFSALEPEPEPDPRPDAEPGEHDELEETPDFLQETPEHDRLWFEQKPPRDFDF